MLINLPVFECVHKQKQNICHSASPVNQNEEGSSILSAENSSVHVSWERGNVIAVSVNEVFERTCHLSSLCGLYSPKDTTAEDLCRMHIVPGLHLVEDLVKAKTVWTLSGHQLTFSSQVKDHLRWSPGPQLSCRTDWSLSIISLVLFLIQKPLFSNQPACYQNNKLLCGVQSKVI